MPETVNVKDLLRVCEEAADMCRNLYGGILDNKRSTDMDFAALAYFMHKEDVYRNEIPAIIRTLVEELGREGDFDA